MTLAEWYAAVDGYLAAHAPNRTESAIEDDEFLRVLAAEMEAGRA